MKKYLIGLILVMPYTYANAGDVSYHSTSCTNTVVTSWTSYNIMSVDPNCSQPSTSPSCFQCETDSTKGIKFYPCSQCASGYALQHTESIISTTCGNMGGGICTKCTGCSNCTSTSWTAAGTGYETRTAKTCSCNTCSSSTEYRCAVGYYGTPTSNTSGCSRCPSSGGTYGTTASAGSTDVTKCYLPSGTTFSDDTGSGTYTDKCYFKVP